MNAGAAPYCNPRQLAVNILLDHETFWDQNPKLLRTLYFDAEPGLAEVSTDLSSYWDAVESLPDTHLGFGWLRGKSNRRGPRQKAVDTLLAVEMLSGAFTKRYELALLVAGDADFVPVVNEVRRAGPHVVVAASSDESGQARFECSKELRGAADRFVKLPGHPSHPDFRAYFEALKYTS
jgi:uncharacterized LabA/DUF88 family protein